MNTFYKKNQKKNQSPGKSYTIITPGKNKAWKKPIGLGCWIKGCSIFSKYIF